MDFKSGKMTIAVFALFLITGILGIVAASDTRNEAEVAAFYTAGLPNHLITELSSIQVQRQQVNTDISGRVQEWNAYGMRHRKVRSTCAYRELSATEKINCDQLKQSLADEGARFHELVLQDKQNLAAVIEHYNDFKTRANAWLDDHAATSLLADRSAGSASRSLAYQHGVSNH